MKKIVEELQVTGHVEMNGITSGARNESDEPEEACSSTFCYSDIL